MKVNTFNSNYDFTYLLPSTRPRLIRYDCSFHHILDMKKSCRYEKNSSFTTLKTQKRCFCQILQDNDDKNDIEWDRTFRPVLEKFFLSRKATNIFIPYFLSRSYKENLQTWWTSKEKMQRQPLEGQFYFFFPIILYAFHC